MERERKTAGERRLDYLIDVYKRRALDRRCSEPQRDEAAETAAALGELKGARAMDITVPLEGTVS